MASHSDNIPSLACRWRPRLGLLVARSVATMVLLYSSMTSIHLRSLGVGVLVGARGRASAVFWCFPCTYSTSGAYLAILSRNLRILGGSFERSVIDNRGTRGRWSVSRVKVVPRMYVENFSHAHVAASASFSMTAYHFSVSLSEREE